jgi:ABC-type polysaccharide transport system permease subunit
MVLPGIAFMIVFNYIPIYGIIIAFKNYTVVDSISSADWVGLENFKIIFEDAFFWEAVRNTLAISLLKLALGFFIPIALAIMIFEMKDGKLFLDCPRWNVNQLALNFRILKSSINVIRCYGYWSQSLVRSR